MEYKVQNIEYRRTNPQSSLPTLPSHTPTYTNIILMDSWSISNPTGHPVRSQAQSGTHPQSHWPPCAFTGCTCNPTGISMPSQGCTLRQIPNQDAPLKLSPQSWILCFYTIYLTRDSTAQRVCSPGAGFNPPEILSLCGIPVPCCLATSVVWSRSAGPRITVVFSRPGSLWFWEA